MATIQTSDYTEVIDHQTGKIVQQETKRRFIERVPTEQFYMVYFTYMRNYYKIKSVKSTFLLAKMCELAEYNTGQVPFPNAIKKRICKEIGLNYSNISRNLKELESLGLISRLGDGLYQVNQKICWKGTAETRNRILGNNCNISIEFSVQPDFEMQ